MLLSSFGSSSRSVAAQHGLVVLLLVKLSCGLILRGGNVTTPLKPGALKKLTSISDVSMTNGKSLNTKVTTPLNANATEQKAASLMNHMSLKNGGFRAWYDAHTTGRGIWKWQNALDAYQRHFGMTTGAPLKISEVGVQSGGSLLMWQGVLGPQIWLYGLDINPACKAFEGSQVTVTIGDQADPAMWTSFFTNTGAVLDVLVDDGGHEAHQMIQTLVSPWPHIQPGGHIAIEDIHGEHYLESFFKPAAWYIGSQWTGTVDSVHMYPFLLVVKKAGQRSDVPVSQLDFSHLTKAIQVSDFAAMWTAIQNNPGSQIILQNAAWGPFLTSDGLTNFFSQFVGLHGGSFSDNPVGCKDTSAAVCTNSITPMTNTQNLVTGIHVYYDGLLVEVAPAPPVIQAVRKGTEWIGYGF